MLPAVQAVLPAADRRSIGGSFVHRGLLLFVLNSWRPSSVGPQLRAGARTRTDLRLRCVFFRRLEGELRECRRRREEPAPVRSRVGGGLLRGKPRAPFYSCVRPDYCAGRSCGAQEFDYIGFQCNVVTLIVRTSDALSLVFLNLADFKGIRFG